MLIVVSPAKTLDFDSRYPEHAVRLPRFNTEAAELIASLQRCSAGEVASLMGLSDTLAALNVARYAQWRLTPAPDDLRPAVLAFKGDVYKGMMAEIWGEDILQRAEQQLRILSGLYGLLRPLDSIQAYRLEMGVKLSNRAGKDLYAFWKEKVTGALQQDMALLGEGIRLVNLASQEYSRAIDVKRLGHEVITPEFRDLKGGQYKIVSFYAKRARGLMASWILRQQPGSFLDLQAFAEAGYRYEATLSRKEAPVFIRDEPVVADGDFEERIL